MRTAPATVVICTVGFLALTVYASEKPSDAYQETMKALGAANQALRTDIKAVEAAGAYPDYMPVEKDAAALKAAFAQTLTYWQAKKVDEAAGFATGGGKGVVDLEGAIKEKSYSQLVAAQTAIGAACQGCHMAYRVRLPDGSYEIK
jgi:hypothetical protein